MLSISNPFPSFSLLLLFLLLISSPSLLLTIVHAQGQLSLQASCPLVDPSHPSGPTDCSAPPVYKKSIPPTSVPCVTFSKGATTVQITDSSFGRDIPTYHCDPPYGVSFYSDDRCQDRYTHLEQGISVNKYAGVEVRFYSNLAVEDRDAIRAFRAYKIDQRCRRAVTDVKARPTAVATQLAGPLGTGGPVVAGVAGLVAGIGGRDLSGREVGNVGGDGDDMEGRRRKQRGNRGRKERGAGRVEE